MKQKDFLLFAEVLVGILIVASFLSYVTTNAISSNQPFSVTPVTSLCKDSDGGNDIYTKGKVTQGTKTITDSCVPHFSFRGIKSYLREGLCQRIDVGGKAVFSATTKDLECPKNGTTQYACSNGACEPQGRCYDGDQGKDYNFIATICVGTACVDDKCISNSTLKEYYCKSPTSRSYVNYKCPNGCENGECIGKTLTLTSDIPG